MAARAFASTVWGVNQNEYLRRAEPWPLNPDGELLFGAEDRKKKKKKNPRADANVDALVRVPGIAFAEWGPGDHGFFMLGRPGTYPQEQGGQNSPVMQAVRRRVLDATKAAGIMFLNACSPTTVEQEIRDGTMICTGGDSPAADMGRKFSGRTDPW